MLQSKGLETVEDLINYFPFRYEDRSNLKTIDQLAPGELATVIAEVRSTKISGMRRRNIGLFELNLRRFPSHHPWQNGSMEPTSRTG